MGRYVTIIAQDFKIKAENVGAAYRAAVALNADDSKKSTRYRGPEPLVKPEDSKSVASSPEVSFRGVRWNYDEECNTIAEVLREFGFEPEVASDGSIKGLWFDDKFGDEQLVLEAIAPYVEDGSMLCWAEGYYDMWSMWFLNGSVKDGPCEIVWSRPADKAA